MSLGMNAKGMKMKTKHPRQTNLMKQLRTMLVTGNQTYRRALSVGDGGPSSLTTITPKSESASAS